MILRSFLILGLILWSINNIQAQEDSTKLKIFEPAPTLNKGRIIGLSTSLGATYAGAMIGLNYIWYKDSPRSNFKFFNDAKEWKQVDKLGHLHTAYFESVWATQLLKWAGVEHLHNGNE